MIFLKNILRNTFIYNILYRMWNQRVTEQDRKMLKFYSQFIMPGDLCFDVGANIGNRTKIFRKLGAKVVAIEPQPKCLEKLRILFKNDKKTIIVDKALGDSIRTGEIFISNNQVLSSISQEWIEAVKISGRFAGTNWDQKIAIQITTLDSLIEIYGEPNFIKIDVEGYEYEVLKGLTRPIKYISLEFTPEIINNTLRCIDYLSFLGNITLNYSLGESMSLEMEEWVSPKEISDILMGYKSDNKTFGDIYVTCSNFH